MKNDEAQAFIIEICQQVILGLALQHRVENDRLNVRIDLQELHLKPVFALFDKSALITKCTMNEIIHAGGGKGLEMVVGDYIRNIIRDIFSASMKQFEIEGTRQMFVLLSLKVADGENVPMISVYKNGKFLDSVPVGDFIEVAK